MLSSPMGLPQQAAAGLVRWISSVSIGAEDCGFVIVAKFPNVLPCLPLTANTTVEFTIPVKPYGIWVVLEYRSTELNRKLDPPAVTFTSPSVVMPAGVEN